MKDSLIKAVVILAVIVQILAVLPSCALAEEHFAVRARNKGPNKKLLGNAEVVVVLVSTPAHPWTDKKRNELFKVCDSSVKIMNSCARKYKANLNMTWGYVEFSIPYEYSSDLKWYWHIVNKIYQRKNMDEICAAYRRDDHKDESAVVFMFNSWDTSHTYEVTEPEKWNEEFCVIFCDTKMHDNYLTHEVLHLYGAIDLYDYHGEGVEKVAMKYFKNSDMRIVSHEVDELTAYLVGWTDTPSRKAQAFLDETKGLR